VDSPDDVSEYFDVMTTETVKRKAAVAAVTIQVKDTTCFRLIDALTKSVKAGRDTSGAAQQLDRWQTGFQQLLEAMPHTTIGKVEEKRLSEFDRNAAEL
jgi:GH24 family phage-related lysozyme (muramidase)